MSHGDAATGRGRLPRPAFTSRSLAAEIAQLTAQLPTLGDPADEAALLTLLRLLHAIGRRDLPLGRLFEGHVDALQIVARYGTAAQAAAAQAAAARGESFGVWNADLPGEPLRLERDRLVGGKGFASGGGLLRFALVTADGADGRQLLLLDLSVVPPEIDRSWWHVTGMQRSETHIVRWADQHVPPAAFLGRPGDYAREPWFGSGAIRFVAVQAGGVAALLDHSRDHLRAAGRDGDPHQLARLAELFGLAEAAAGAVRWTAGHWFEDEIETKLARVAAARTIVADAAERALSIAQAAVGVQGLFHAHPLAAAVSDLAVYLRQPAPDAQRLRAGRGVADGRLDPVI